MRKKRGRRGEKPMRVMARLEGWTLYSEAPRMIPTPTPSNVHQINIFIRNHLLLNRFHRLLFLSWPAATSGFTYTIHTLYGVLGLLVTWWHCVISYYDWKMYEPCNGWWWWVRRFFLQNSYQLHFLQTLATLEPWPLLVSLLRPRLRPLHSTCNFFFI